MKVSWVDFETQNDENYSTITKEQSDVEELDCSYWKLLCSRDLAIIIFFGIAYYLIRKVSLSALDKFLILETDFSDWCL